MHNGQPFCLLNPFYDLTCSFIYHGYSLCTTRNTYHLFYLFYYFSHTMKVPSVDTLVGRRRQRVGRPFTSEHHFPRLLQFVAFTSDRSNLFTVETLNVESNAVSVNQRETRCFSSSSSLQVQARKVAPVLLQIETEGNDSFRSLCELENEDADGFRSQAWKRVAFNSFRKKSRLQATRFSGSHFQMEGGGGGGGRGRDLLSFSFSSFFFEVLTTCS